MYCCVKVDKTGPDPQLDNRVKLYDGNIVDHLK